MKRKSFISTFRYLLPERNSIEKIQIVNSCQFNLNKKEI